MNDEPPILTSKTAPHPVWWVIAVSLAVIAITLVLRQDHPFLPEAFAQPTRQAGARGIFSFSGQLTPNSFGLFMVDVDNQTIWGYEFLGDRKKLRLAFARSWSFDKYLDNQDFEGPSPVDVERLVEQQRLNKLRRRSNNSP